jgi:hypothetical protein
MTTRRETKAEKAANARWQARRRELIRCGQWEPFVDAEPVREHLRQVNAAGMSYMAICERLGLAQNSSLQYLMWGRGAYGPGQQVRRETAELILSYWPSLEDYPDGARIDATGTRRRVEALAVRGWARHFIAERVAMNDGNFRKAVNRNRVTAKLARGVAAAYDELWDKDPLEHGVPLSSVTRVRADATRLGFLSPLAWDDDTIDDPAAIPQTDAPTPTAESSADAAARFLMGESVILNAAGRREVIAHLMEWTEQTPEQIGEQLGMTGDTVSRSWERIKVRSRVEGGKGLRRRVFVASVPDRRTKNLTRVEMESAA